MTFTKITSQEPVAAYLYEHIATNLAQGKRVLWLIPGGSAIPIAQAVIRQLANIDVSKLAITLTDERYVSVGHADENWKVIMKGAPALDGTKLVPVNTGKSMKETTKAYAQNIQKLLDWADVCIGFFGIGPDGHTAGILPLSPAATSTLLVASYDAGNFKRITITPLAIKRLNLAVAYAVGPEKAPVLEKLDQSIDIPTMPSQALKTAKQTIIFNDYRGDK